MTASYKLGGDLYNSTLIERVENVTGFGNLDKRVAQTWTKPGDHAPYKLIEMRQNPNDSGETTRPTSRFVQKNNELYFSSVNFGYDFYRMKFVKKIGLERLKLTFYADEIAPSLHSENRTRDKLPVCPDFFPLAECYILMND